jgi:hypothetical protein
LGQVILQKLINGGGVKMRNLLSFQFFLIVSLLFSNIVSYADCQYCCKRRAFLAEFVNPHNPDFEKAQDEWVKCIEREMKGYKTLLENDPIYQKALSKCKAPPDYMTPSSVGRFLIHILTTDYFHFSSVSGSAIPSSVKAEYFFRGSFEMGIDDGAFLPNGKPVTSRFKLALYYNGDSEELVKEWQDEKSHPNPIPGHNNSMFKNPTAKMREDTPIHEKLLWDFEKTPVECEIKPEKKELYPGEAIDITLSDFKDRKGQRSRSFQRIVANAEHGYVLNGTPVSDPEYEAYWVGENNPKIKYSAPCTCEQTQDTITIYNSCDILKRAVHPLELTTKKDKIAELKVKIKCDKGSLTILRTDKHRQNKNRVDKDKDGKVIYTLDENLVETMSVSIKAKLVHQGGMAIPGTDHFREWYKVKNPRIISRYVQHNKDKKGRGSNTTLDASEKGEFEKTLLVQPNPHEMLVVIYNKDKTKIVNAIIPAYFAETKWKNKIDLIETRQGVTTKEEHKTRKEKERFLAGRFKKPASNPYNITGNPKSFSSREEDNEATYDTILDKGYITTIKERVYNWSVSLE